MWQALLSTYMSPYLTALYNITNQALTHFAYNAIYTYSWLSIKYRRVYRPAITYFAQPTNAASASTSASTSFINKPVITKSFIDVYKDCYRISRIEYDHTTEQYILSPSDLMNASNDNTDADTPTPRLVVYCDEQQNLKKIVKCFDMKEVYDYMFTHPFSVAKSTADFLMTEITYCGSKSKKEVTKLINMKQWQVEDQILDKYFFYYVIFVFNNERILDDEYCTLDDFKYNLTIIDNEVNQTTLNERETVILNNSVKNGYKILVEEKEQEQEELKVMENICMPSSIFLSSVEKDDNDDNIPTPPLRNAANNVKVECVVPVSTSTSPPSPTESELLESYMMATYVDDYTSTQHVEPANVNITVQKIDGEIDYIHL